MGQAHTVASRRRRRPPTLARTHGGLFLWFLTWPRTTGIRERLHALRRWRRTGIVFGFRGRSDSRSHPLPGWDHFEIRVNGRVVHHDPGQNGPNATLMRSTLRPQWLPVKPGRVHVEFCTARADGAEVGDTVRCIESLDVDVPADGPVIVTLRPATRSSYLLTPSTKPGVVWSYRRGDRRRYSAFRVTKGRSSPASTNDRDEQTAITETPTAPRSPTFVVLQGITLTTVAAGAALRLSRTRESRFTDRCDFVDPDTFETVVDAIPCAPVSVTVGADWRPFVLVAVVAIGVAGTLWAWRRAARARPSSPSPFVEGPAPSGRPRPSAPDRFGGAAAVFVWLSVVIYGLHVAISLTGDDVGAAATPLSDAAVGLLAVIVLTGTIAPAVIVFLILRTDTAGSPTSRWTTVSVASLIAMIGSMSALAVLGDEHQVARVSLPLLLVPVVAVLAYVVAGQLLQRVRLETTTDTDQEARP